ncbi:MAG TPA: DUF3329 domain-containing protein [Mesorhizobium sp.]|jgi:hypothetical protein|nr:DUF3329 domain-containing protein [Mesorhizobium sp.]
MNRDADHPFLRPLWRRVALVAFCAAWGLFELVSGSPGWALLFGGMAAYGAWLYLINYRPGEAPPGDTRKE